jgi:hypothetical protein
VERLVRAATRLSHCRSDWLRRRHSPVGSAIKADFETSLLVRLDPVSSSGSTSAKLDVVVPNIELALTQRDGVIVWKSYMEC